MTKKGTTSREIIHLAFPPDISGEPVVCDLARKYDLCFSILKAQITPRQEGFMTLEVTGDPEGYRKGMDYLAARGIRITPVAQSISRDEDSCMHCGLCTALCPTRSLHLDKDSRKVAFDAAKCSGCAICVKVCPVHAMDTALENGQS